LALDFDLAAFVALEAIEIERGEQAAHAAGAAPAETIQW